ncbi:MAG: alpha-galactosidase, partial [Lachnospiraceae bacterium]|nr:alpha-galactosidase [Lachnospiraceae bacterium]
DITLVDAALQVKVHLLYGVMPKLDVITRAVRIENTGAQELRLEKVLSANLDFVSGDFNLLTFSGRHAMERNLVCTPVSQTEQVITSRRGFSSHQENPLLLLAEKSVTESSGTCYAMEFVYSGGFTGLTALDPFNQTRMQLGLMEERFSYPLAPGAEFYAPEVIMSCSTEGLDRLSNQLQRCIRTRVVRGPWRDQSRPVLLNSWEAFYMDFTADDLTGLAEQTKELGLDMLVLDDGWFGTRCDDNRALGDWFVNEEKLGGTLSDLVDTVHGMGLKFGLWIEPEMVNEDSDLYREHPDWALTIPGRKPIRSRNQLVLDFSRKEVVDEIFSRISAVLDKASVDYIKWDCNRSIADFCSGAAQDSGRVFYDFILGVYDFLERLLTRYPNLLIEGCSGGGGRFDAGMMYYTPQIWCSDNTDPIDRLRIQYGTSFGYPASSVGAHVSKSPNEQTGRVTPLATRGITAMQGGFGYELNPAVLSEEEREEIREITKTYRRYERLISTGDYHRLSNPFTDAVGAWAYTSEDGSESLLNMVVLEIHGNRPVSYIRLRGLTAGALYQDTETGRIYPADMLTEVGIPVPQAMGEYKSYQMHLKRV